MRSTLECSSGRFSSSFFLLVTLSLASDNISFSSEVSGWEGGRGGRGGTEGREGRDGGEGGRGQGDLQGGS